MLAKQQDSDDEREHSTVQTMEFMRAQYPCPAINITEAGNFTREYFYLDTINQFLTRKACLRWGNVIFSEKYPASNKELY